MSEVGSCWQEIATRPKWCHVSNTHRPSMQAPHTNAGDMGEHSCHRVMVSQRPVLLSCSSLGLEQNWVLH